MNALADHPPYVTEIEQCTLTYWGISRQQVGHVKFTSIIRTNEKTCCVLMELLRVYTKSTLGEHLHALRASDMQAMQEVVKARFNVSYRSHSIGETSASMWSASVANRALERI
jgi:hypothetical protein